MDTHLKAFAYVRCSGMGQVDGDSFPRQMETIRKYADENGIEIVKTFEEKGICGKTEWESRPEWVSMIGSMNGVRTILIEKLDRLARGVMVQEHIIEDLGKRKVTLISAMEPDLCTDDPTRVFMRQVFGAMAGYDRAMIVQKLRAARERAKLKNGYCEGRKPYGFKDGEREILDRILGMAGTMTQTEIAAALNAQGIKPRSGGKWWPRVVGRILKAQEVMK